MKTSGTRQECQDIETKAIALFQEEFNALCEKHEIQAIVLGSRRTTEHFTDDDESSLTAGFLATHIVDPDIKEVKALTRTYEEADGILKEISISAMLRTMFKQAKDIAENPKEKPKSK